jgi:polysaccharide export outer membrane protein
MRRYVWIVVILFATVLLPAHARSQVGDRYILGQEKKLEMMVHILGEVRNPGEYQVVDGTSVLELLSKAGGPTEFSQLGNITLTRALGAANSEPRVVSVNISQYLSSSQPVGIPALQPGDVVMVPRNRKYRWKLFAGIVRDLSVVASAYFLGVRAFKD